MLERWARRDLYFSVALFLVALLPRLYVALAWAHEPVWDGHYYDFGARRIAEGFGYSDDVVTGTGTVWHPWCHYPVGYSAFLAAVYWLFGATAPSGTVAGAVVGALTAVLVHRFARYATTVDRARIAGALTALNPGLIMYSGLLMTEPLAGLGLLATAWVVARYADRSQSDALLTRRMAPAWLFGGLALGLTTLVRPQSLLVAPALALLIFPAMRARDGNESGAKRTRPLWRACAFLLLVGTGLTAVVAPWTVRNCRVMDGCALVSTNGGWNLAIGASPRATGRFGTLTAADGCRIVTGQVQQDRCWWERGVTWIRDDPGRWVGLMPQKLGYTFDHESFPVGYLAEADPAGWSEDRKHRTRRGLSIWHRALLSLAALGVLQWPWDRTRRRVRWLDAGGALMVVGLTYYQTTPESHAWPLAVLISAFSFVHIVRAFRSRSTGASAGIAYAAWAVLTVCVTHAVFFGEDRYHVVVTPLLCLLAACAFSRPEAPPAASVARSSSGASCV